MHDPSEAVGTFAVCAVGGAIIVSTVMKSIFPVIIVTGGMIALYTWASGGAQALSRRTPKPKKPEDKRKPHGK